MMSCTEGRAGSGVEMLVLYFVHARGRGCRRWYKQRVAWNWWPRWHV